MRNRRRRIVLKVVGRKQVVNRRHERLKVSPSAAGGPPQRLLIGLGHRQTRRGGGRQAYKASNGGRGEPERSERKRHRPRPVAKGERDNGYDRADDNRARHSARESH